MSYGLGFVLDGIILVFLCVTIFYAARLTIFFKTFREGRYGLQRLINDLSVSVTKAESAIAMMKKNAVESEKDLRDLVSESKFLSDELRFMNEAGDGLAKRLERLAERNRELLTLMEGAGGIGNIPGEAPLPKITEKPKAATRTKRKAKPAKPFEKDVFRIEEFEMDQMDQDDEADFQAFSVMDDEPLMKIEKSSTQDNAFSIFDRDLEADVVEKPKTQKSDQQEEQFYSRAEQDLYEALQRKKSAKKNTGSK